MSRVRSSAIVLSLWALGLASCSADDGGEKTAGPNLGGGGGIVGTGSTGAGGGSAASSGSGGGINVGGGGAGGGGGCYHSSSCTCFVFQYNDEYFTGSD